MGEQVNEEMMRKTGKRDRKMGGLKNGMGVNERLGSEVVGEPETPSQPRQTLRMSVATGRYCGWPHPTLAAPASPTDQTQG